MRSEAPNDIEVRALARKAAEAGCRVVQRTLFDWDISADCDQPYVSEHCAEPTIPIGANQRVREDYHGIPISVIVRTRCHKCPACLKARYWMWRLRAATELSFATRTWFGTLTLSPEAHYHMRCKADLELRAREVTPFDECDADAQFVARHNAIARDITLWLKRIRKQSGASIRYLLVCEAHKSGLPHYHILVHQRGDVQIQKRTLEDWPLGFSSWKLCDDAGRSSAYVTKYLLKDARARLRASVRYGQCPEDCVDLSRPKPSL